MWPFILSDRGQGRPVSTGEGHSFVGFCLFVKRIGETAPGAGVASVNLTLHLVSRYCAFLVWVECV